MRQLILKNFTRLLSIGDQAIVSGSNFLSALIIAKFSGLDVYGEYALWWTGFFLIQSAANSFIGLPFLIIGNKKAKDKNYFTNNLTMLNNFSSALFIIMVIVMCIIQFVFQLLPNYYSIITIPAAIMLFVLHEQHRKYFFSKDEKFKVILIDIIAYLLLIPTFVLVGFLGYLSFSNIFNILCVTGVLANIAFYHISKESLTLGNWKSMPIQENWNYSKYLVFTNVIQWSSGNFLLLSLATIAGSQAVGTVRLIQNLMGVLHVFFITLENNVPAKASMLLHQHSKKHFSHYFKSVAKKTSIFFVALLTLIWLFRADILAIVYGSKLADFTSLFSLFIALYFLVFIGTLIQIYMKISEINKGIFLAYILSFAASFSISNYFIETFDIQGYVYGLIVLQIVCITTYLFKIKSSKT